MMRYVDDGEAIKLTNRQAIGVLDALWSNPLFGKAHRQAFEIGVKAIKALEQEPKTGRWIPVSERLPNPYEQVLRTVKSFGWNSTFHIHVDIGTICPIDTDVIAWMPLPKPYTEESEELK